MSNKGENYLDVVAWFKDSNTLHFFDLFNGRADFVKLRIKKIYGIK